MLCLGYKYLRNNDLKTEKLSLTSFWTKIPLMITERIFETTIF